MNWAHPIWYSLLDFFGVRDEAGWGYGLFSGFFGDITIIAGGLLGLRHLNCHRPGCWRLGKHVTPDGYRLCKTDVGKPLHELDLHEIHKDHQ